MRRSPLVVMTAVLALTALAGCSDDEKKAAPTPAAGSVPPSAPEPTESLDVPDSTTGTLKPEPSGVANLALFQVEPTGGGPYEVGETQAALTEAGLLAPPVDAGGCATAAGKAKFGAAEVFLSQGKVVMVKATKDDPRIGKPLADAEAEYPEGTKVSGAGGAEGWKVVEEGNTLIFAATGGTISAVTGGVSASVEKNFTSGSGC